MAIEVQIEYIRTATVRAYVTVTDDDGELKDPSTSIKLDVWDKAGNKKVDQQAMNKLATGTYDYGYDTTTDDLVGWWKGIVWVVDGGHTSHAKFGFKVEAKPT